MSYQQPITRNARTVRQLVALAAMAAAPVLTIPSAARAGAVARPDHIVIVIEENHDADQVLGSPNAPYINGLAKQGILYTNAHGTDHPSQPNYLEMFAGANPGVAGINFPNKLTPSSDPNSPFQQALDHGDDANTIPFNTPNLGHSLLTKGLTFAGYSEGLPAVGSTVVQDVAGYNRAYVQKHNAWVQWQGSDTNQLPIDTNQPLTAFPTDFSKLPTVSFVVPNEQNDMHDQVSLAGLRPVKGTNADPNGGAVSDDTTIQHGDTWLKDNIDAYAQWAKANNSLLVVTWDENDYDFTNANNIPMFVVGSPNLIAGAGLNDRNVNHFDLLRTVEDQYGLAPLGESANAAGLTFDAGTGKLTAVPLPAAAWTGILGLGVLAGGYSLRARKLRMA